MAFTVKMRMLGEASGSGEERKISGFATLTTPTQVSGPIHQVVVSTAPVDLVSLISGQLVMLFIEAISSGVYLNPCASTPIVTCGCFISEGNFAFVPFKTTISALPFVQAQTARAEIETWIVGIT